MKTNLQEDLKARVRALDDEKLVKDYLKREGYAKEYVTLVEEQLVARGLSPGDLTSEDAATSILMRKKSDKELHALYLDLQHTPARVRQLAEEEVKRRGQLVDTIEKVRVETRIRDGQCGEYIVAGYVFSVLLGGVIGLGFGLNYFFATRQLADGEVVHKYNRATRTNGAWMLVIAAIIITLFTAKVINEF
jgi:hypothetical protein